MERQNLTQNKKVIEAFGILEGGGAKGLAHIGALHAVEERNIRFIGIAGTSAGALVAALVAAGYTAPELFDANSLSGVFNVDFIRLLGRRRWQMLQIFRKLLKIWNYHWLIRVLVSLLVLMSLLGFLLWLPKYLLAVLVVTTIALILLLNRLLGSLGIFSTHKFEEWLNRQLQQKLFPAEAGRIVTFEDLPVSLQIIATDLTNRKIVVFNREKYPQCVVAKAVGASIAIPGVFRPPEINNMILVDGGVLSNFPAWVFDDDRERQKEIVPTFGFRLTSVPSAVEASAGKWKTLLGYAAAFFKTTLFGDSVLEVREIEDLNLIPIRVTADTLDFDLNVKDKLALWNAGLVAAGDFFRHYIGPKDPEQINQLLAYLKDKFLAEILSGGVVPQNIPHLRINVALPVEPKRRKLRILYHHNMTADADQSLVLGVNEGAIGRCWQTHRMVAVDMEQAKNTFESEWQMSKMQQALVRPTLKSLLSIPIFEPKIFDNRKPWTQNDVFAILSLDSDDNLLKVFAAIENEQEPRLRQLLVDFSFQIGRELRR